MKTFKYLDKVRVISGFYEGQTGTVIAECYGCNPKQYRVLLDKIVTGKGIIHGPASYLEKIE